MTHGGASAGAGVRLDVWLHVACLFPTRSRAKAACEAGKVDVNGSAAKAHREVNPGDRLAITTPSGRRRELMVRALADRSIPKAQARALYEDVTPPEPAAFVETRRLDRMLARSAPSGRPDKRDRRELRRRKESRGIDSLDHRIIDPLAGPSDPMNK